MLWISIDKVIQLAREYIRECTQGKGAEPRDDWTKF